MKTLLILFLVALVGVLPARADGMALAGSEWGFSDVDKRFITFSADGKVAGHAGCNRFFGTYAEDGEGLSIGLLGMTRMMCPPADMERERAFTVILQNTSRFEATHLKLTLYAASGKVMTTLKRRDFD